MGSGSESSFRPGRAGPAPELRPRADPTTTPPFPPLSPIRPAAASDLDPRAGPVGPTPADPTETHLGARPFPSRSRPPVGAVEVGFVDSALRRPASESRSSVVRLMVPTDANFVGNVFGGAILADMDRLAYIAATRHSKSNCVTASFDRVDFLRPVHVGQVVEYDGRITFVGRSSMEVTIESRAEALEGGDSYPVVRAWVTMVAVGPSGHPIPVPSLELTTDEERDEFERGRARAEARRRSRGAARAAPSEPRRRRKR